MLGILKHILSWFSRTIKAVERWILKTIAAVYSYFDRIVTRLWHGLADVWKGLVAFSRSIRKWAASVYHLILWIIHKAIPDVISWALKQLRKVFNYAIAVYRTLVKWVDYLITAIRKAISDITQWVIKNIWRPLDNAITTAWHWITHEGTYILDLLTHPEKLVKLLAHWLWISWLDLIRQFARPIARWLLSEFVRMPDELANVLDILISSIL